MTKIYVIIPVYNAIKYLRETVDSVLGQPYKDVDIILVDDGSTDGSSILCDKIAVEECRVSVIHQKNAGVSAARNTGIDFVLREGTQGYVAFLDADDVWCLNVITDMLIEAKVGGADVILFGSLSGNETLTAFSTPLTYTERCCPGGEGVIWPMIGTFCANLYSSELLKTYSIRFTEGLKYAEDKIFKMQCVFLADEVQYLPDILHIYRQNSNSAMQKVFLYTPIDYYIPIINGWIASDDCVNSMEERTKKHINAGYTLACIYFGDMTIEHFKRWGSRRTLLEACTAHPFYHLYENMDPKAVSTKQYRNQQMFFAHPMLFAWKYRVIGAAELCARLLIRLPFIRKYRMKKKYPLRELPAVH